MRFLRPLLASLVFLASGSSMASPLSLDYSTSAADGNQYHYNFVLTLDNHDNSWSAGQSFAWLVFGDADDSPSPLTDFVLDPDVLPVGPWMYLYGTFGGHNGPTFADVLAGWEPSAVNDSLHWSGTSTADLEQGQLLFSTLITRNGAQGAIFEVADKVGNSTDVPEPASLALLGLGLAGLGAVRRRT